MWHCSTVIRTGRARAHWESLRTAHVINRLTTEYTAYTRSQLFLHARYILREAAQGHRNGKSQSDPRKQEHNARFLKQTPYGRLSPGSDVKQATLVYANQY